MAEITKTFYKFMFRENPSAGIEEKSFSFYIDDSINYEDTILSILTGSKHFIPDELQEGVKYYQINLIIHSAKNILTGQVSTGDKAYHFGQELLEGEGSKTSAEKYPILHVSMTDLFADSLYGNASLPTLIPRSFQIMDSSIWNYLIPLTKDATKVQDMFYKAVKSIHRNYLKGLYNLSVAKEYADLNARIVTQAYLASSHASGVSPFIFHSESAIKRIIKDEFIIEQPIIERVKNRKWRILLVDDKAAAPMENDKEDNNDRFSWNCKLTIIKQLLEKQFGLDTDYSHAYNKGIPCRHWNRLKYIDDNESDLFIEFERPVNNNEIDKICEKLKELNVFENKTSFNPSDGKYSHLKVSFNEIPEQNKLEISCKSNEDVKRIFDTLSILKNKCTLKDKIIQYWKKLFLKTIDFSSQKVHISYKMVLLVRYKLWDNICENNKIYDSIKKRIEDVITEINKGFPEEAISLSCFELINNNEISFLLTPKHSLSLSLEHIKYIKNKLSSIEFNVPPYSGIRIPLQWDDETNKKIRTALKELNFIKSDVKTEIPSPFVIEYAETEKEAEEALQTKKYDLILLDYLLKDDTGNHYGYELLENISKHAKDGTYTKGMGPNGKFFFMFISAYSSAVYERLLAEGLNQTEDYWQIAIGACPTNTPQLFLYNLIKLMDNRLEHSGIDKISTQKIYELVEGIYYPIDGSVRKQANNKYQEILSLQYHYRKMLKDVDIPEENSIFNSKGSVLITDFVKKNLNLGGMLEHLTQLIHLTAFGTIRQWPEMWEEFIYFKGQFKAQNDIAGTEAVSDEAYQEMTGHIENYIKTLKMQ